MSVSDAITARGMAQRITAALPTIQQNFFRHNALLALIQMRNQIKWGGSGVEFDWFIRKVPDASNKPSFGGGNLSVRTFEELNPANMAKLPYCWLERTYGISDRTIEGNRHASGRVKVYDVLKEQLTIAKISAYNALCPSIYTGNGTGENPAGLIKAIGTAYETGDATTVTAGQTYAGRTLNTGAVAAYNANRITMGWADEQFAPTVLGVHECPVRTAAGPKWTLDCVKVLAWMADEMSVTADVSGTGTPVKPDIAVMNTDPYASLKALLAGNSTTYNVPVGNEKLLIAGWANIQVDTLLCIRDTAVPHDGDHGAGSSYERVLCIDSKQIKLSTTHTKAEGIFVNEFTTNDPLISGAIGVLKANLNWMVASPVAVGAILGCND